MSPCELLDASECGQVRAAELLRNGDLVAVPTETVYGLAANALDTAAVRRIFEVKGRPLVDPLIVHCRSLAQVLEAATTAPRLQQVAEAFWPGPLTVVLNKQAGVVPDLVTAGLGSVAVRISAHPVLHALLERLPFPLAAPSANPFGYISPTRPEHVVATLGGRIAAVLDGGPSRHGVESTILDLREDTRPRILRPGPIGPAELEEALGVACEVVSKAAGAGEAQAAPGQLGRHYSPRTRLDLVDYGGTGNAEPELSPAFAEASACGRSALVFFKRPAKPVGADAYWLSEDGDPRAAAAALFDLLIRLDGAGYDRIAVEKAPDQGIGLAINDRLRRAAAH